MPDVSLIATLIVGGVLFLVAAALTTVLVQISCWLFNKINGLAPPGLGRSDSRDYTVVASPQGRFYQPPSAFTRYDSGKAVAGGVPVPRIMRSAGIALVATTAMLAIVWALWLVIGTAASATGSTPGMTVLLCSLVSVPLDVLILAWLASLILPTNFKRGLMVSLVHFMLLLVLLSMLAIAAVVIGLAVGIRVESLI